MKYISFLLTLALLFTACQSNPVAIDDNRTVTNEDNTLDNVDAAVAATFLTLGKTFKFMTNRSRTIKTDKGTRIHIPENAFVDKLNGNPISGEVFLKFAEFHTNGEIIASQIPMVYTNEAGEKEQFESAGMFEISAFQDDRELALADGKEIEVELVSDVPGNFNFYQLNDDRLDWELKDTDCYPIKNKYLEEQEEALEEAVASQPVQPKRPVPYKKGDKLFDVKMLHYHNSNLEALNGILWKYSGDDQSKNPANNQKEFNSKYKLVYMAPTDAEFLEYELTFESEKDTVELRAVPIFKGKILDRENKRFAKVLKQIQESMERQRKIRNQLKREKKLLRVFKIDELDVYNYDRQFKDPKAIPMFASFEFSGASETEGIMVYLIPSEKRAVVRYTPGTFDRFRLNPLENNKLIAILPDNTIYALSNNDIRKMRLSEKNSGEKVNFILKKYNQPAKRAEELDEVIAGL